MEATDRELWRRADGILDELIDLAPAERHRRLAALEPALRDRVSQLLAALEAEGPLDQPVPAIAAPPPEPVVPRMLGPWHLGAEIGRGGMAVVLAAERELPAGTQRAAVKLLTAGALAADGRRRFLREQQALMRLGHPNIAAILDAGVLDDGTPWLAMERIDGERIDQHVLRLALDPAATVRLFRQVCDAVAFAHRQLVVHRDIKPGNVLVDAGGRARLLDFGIARLLDEGQAGDSTGTAYRVLTRQYAAPEQFSGEDSGTAADVFGLGALLYHLLTGRPPRLAGDGADAGITRPSRAVAQAEAGRQHHGRLLRGDLDAILMKALESEPARRYPDAAALAADLDRWLERRPVLAARGNRMYRARKFISRHRGGVAATTLLAAAVAAGVAGTLWQAWRAEQAAAEAREQAGRAEAVGDYLASALSALVPSTPELVAPDKEVILAEVLARAERELADRPGLYGTVAMHLADIDARLGNYARALATAEAAYARLLEAHGPDAPETALGGVTLAEQLRAAPEYDEARIGQLLDDALRILTVPPTDPEDRIRALLAASLEHSASSRNAEALALLDEAVALRAGLPRDAMASAELDFLRARQLHRLDRFDEAVATYRQVLPVFERERGRVHADTADVMQEYAAVLIRVEQREEGIRLLEEADRINRQVYARPTDISLTTGLHLIRAYSADGRHDEAIRHGREHAARIAASLGETDPAYAAAHHELANAALAAKRPAEALESARVAESVYRERFGDDAARTAVSGSVVGAALVALDRLDEAEAVLERTRQRYASAFGEDSLRMGAVLVQVGKLRDRRGDPSGAAEAFSRAHRIYADGYGPTHGWTLVVGLLLAEAQLDAGRADLAEPVIARTTEGFREAGRPDEDPDRATATLIAAEVACSLGRPDCRERARSALAGLEASLGADHARTLRARQLLEQP